MGDAEQLPVGIIFPPPEIRGIVDKTALFVSRNGAQFEERIKENGRMDAKFSFLNPNDPYRPYYDMKVKEAREGKGDAKKDEKERGVGGGGLQQKRPNEKPIPKEPPPHEFVTSMPNISAQDLDILRLTAMFVARNGRQFLSALSQREQRNFQFEFIKQNHSLYPYFTALVSQYNKVIIPSKAQVGKLQELMDNKFLLLSKISERVEYEKYIAEKKRQAQEEADQERIEYSLIDWHDFVVVETVEFLETDEVLQLPPPISIMDLEGMTLAQKKASSLIDSRSAGLNEGRQEDGGEMDMEEENDVPMSTAAIKANALENEAVPKAGSGPPIKLPQIPGRPPNLPPAPLPQLPNFSARPPGMPPSLVLPPRLPLPQAQSSSGVAPRHASSTRPAEDDDDNAPDMKRQKMAEDFEASLIPEATFLAANPGSIMLIVQVQGSSAVTVPDLPLTLTIGALKDRLAQMTSIQANKQKLALPNGFTLKNTASLAHYNLRNAGTLLVSVRERGGRK